MNFFEVIKDDYRALRGGDPGKRFHDYVDERRERRGGRLSIGRVVNFVLGMALCVIGLAIGWLPGPGGFLAVIGLALIAQEIPLIADLLDWLEVSFRTLISELRKILCI